jgi:integrase/recombinase XerD
VLAARGGTIRALKAPHVDLRATPLRRETAKLLAAWIGADKDENKPLFPSINGRPS